MKKRHRTRPRVLALHAAGATPALWDDVARKAPGLDLVTPDLMALTHAVGGAVGPLVRALAAIVPTGPVTVAGCAIGGNLALELGALLGDRLRGLLLLNPMPVRPDAAFRERSRQLSKLLSAEMKLEEILAWTPIFVSRNGPRGRKAAAQAAEMLKAAGGHPCAQLVCASAELPDGALALKQIRAPVRALFGGDNVNPFPGPGWLESWQAALGADAIEVLPEHRHWLPIEAPDVVASALRQLAEAEELAAGEGNSRPGA